MTELFDSREMHSGFLNPEEKDRILKEEKEKAVGMVKVANFRGGLQDPYPSPFLNLSDTKIPNTSQEIFRWCKYFYMFDPLISGAVNALAAFPITEVYLEEMEQSGNNNEKSETLKTYEKVFAKLGIHKLLIEIGIDYYLYGNCFVFGEMEVPPSDDGQPINYEGIEWKNMIRLDPSKMTIDCNPTTQEKKYKWEVPYSTARIVRNKAPKEEYEKIPEVIRKAVMENKSVILSSKNIYHFSRATDSLGDNNVWGTPVVANVLKLLMYRNTLRQAQEAIAREHIVPMRIYYLQRTEEYNPEADWNKVASDFAGELMKSVRDPNYKVVSPVPVNMLSVGGQGRALLLTPEIQQVQEEILAGMNVPREFLFGGVSYSGSSISLKILENNFITYRLLLEDFMQNFCIKGMAKARREWINEDDDEKLISIKMADLKMQDDVQQKQLIISLNASQKCSDEYMWKVLGIDPDKMKAAIEKEALEKIELQGKITTKNLEIQTAQLEAQYNLQVKQMEFQQKFQRQFPPAPVDGNGMPLQPQDAPVDQVSPIEQVPAPEAPVQQDEVASPAIAENQQLTDPLNQFPEEVLNFAKQVFSLPENYREILMSKIPGEMQTQVKKALGIMSQSKNNKKIDMRPMPEKLPPRRDSMK